MTRSTSHATGRDLNALPEGGRGDVLQWTMRILDHLALTGAHGAVVDVRFAQISRDIVCFLDLQNDT